MNLWRTVRDLRRVLQHKKPRVRQQNLQLQGDRRLLLLLQEKQHIRQQNPQLQRDQHYLLQLKNLSGLYVQVVRAYSDILAAVQSSTSVPTGMYMK